jgi:glyoxylase-like metal-dependent hydrolase (beta-lactamase superfamily II)
MHLDSLSSWRALEPGLWHCQAPNPEWSGPQDEGFRQRLATAGGAPSEAASGLVSSYAIEDDERLLLVDPLAVPREIEELVNRRNSVVVLTSPWHERDTRALVERLEVSVFTPPPDDGSPDIDWLVGDPTSDVRLFSAGERLSLGIEVFPGRLPNDLVLWLESRRALITGDTLIDLGQGLEIPVEWLPEDVSREHVAEGLKRVLDLPVEIVLATHGGPTTKAALDRALAR